MRAGVVRDGLWGSDSHRIPTNPVLIAGISVMPRMVFGLDGGIRPAALAITNSG